MRSKYCVLNLISAILLASGFMVLLPSRAAFSQEDRPDVPLGMGVTDPTRTGAALRDALRAHVIRFRTIELKGLVVSSDDNGVALLGMKDHEPVLVKSNSQFSVEISGVPLHIVVKKVTPAGVEVEAPTLTETLTIPSFSAASKVGQRFGSGWIRHVEFHNVPLSDALRMIVEQCGSNYCSSAEAGKLPVSVFLSDVPAHIAVEEICNSHGLWYRQDESSGILRVMTMQEFERDLVSSHDEQTEVFTLLYPNVYEVATVIQDLYGDRVSLSLGRDDNNEESRDLMSRFQRFDLINQRSQGLGSMQGMGTSQGSGYSGQYGSSYYGGGSSYGGIDTTVVPGYSGAFVSSGRTLAGNNANAASSSQNRNEFRNLTPTQAQKVQRVLSDGASSNGTEQALQPYRERQASIFVTVSRRNNMIIVRSSDSKALEDVRALIRRMDVPTSMVLLEIKILSLDLSDGFRSAFDYQFNGIVGGKSGRSQTTGGFTSGDIQPPSAGSMVPGGAGLNAGDMTFQVVNEYFKARIQLLEEKNRVTTLATPLLLTANNEVSRLFLGEERPLVRNITGQTIITDNSTAVTPSTTIEMRNVGTTVLITANINSDRTVTLRLLQEDSSINAGGASIPIVVSSGMVQNVSIDVVASRSISGTFVAKDDMAVAVGGLITEKITNERAQVPILGNIPLLGVLFRRETKAKTRSELIILIRPHVISTPAEGEGISQKLLRGLSVHPSSPDARGSMNTFKGNIKPKSE
jgi:general secretion pathway protein D